MKRFIYIILASCCFAAPAWADEPTPTDDASAETEAPQSARSSDMAVINIDLDEEKLSIDADIPSVDLILSFRDLQDKSQENAESFLDAVIDSARHDPF